MRVLVINGHPGVGKTTFEKFLQDILGEDYVFIESTIDPIKELARQVGWDGTKTARDRQFLSDLKNLCVGYNDFCFKYIEQKIKYYDDMARGYGLSTDAYVLLVDCREPSEIKKLVDAFGATTVLVTRDEVEQEYSNKSDAEVDNYTYDIIVKNNEDLIHLYGEAVTLCLCVLLDNLRRANREKNG